MIAGIIPLVHRHLLSRDAQHLVENSSRSCSLSVHAVSEDVFRHLPDPSSFKLYGGFSVILILKRVSPNHHVGSICSQDSHGSTVMIRNQTVLQPKTPGQAQPRV